MHYKVADFVSRYSGSFRVIAGESGFDRTIKEVGLLDYELVVGLKERYQRVNFYEGQLVLTTFLYTKDDSYQITEAVKYLYNKGAAALVIKNVFGLQVPDAAVRYANVRGFPLFFISDNVFFDEIILDVGQSAQRMANTAWAQRKIDQLVLDAENPDIVASCARELNPSLTPEHYVLFARTPQEITAERVARIAAQLEEKALLGAGDALYAYDGGALLVCSDSETGDKPDLEVLLRKAFGTTDAIVGISDTHFDLPELGYAVLEAQRAARFAELHGLNSARYADLGALRPLLPFALGTPMQHFTREALDPLAEYDAQTNSTLLQTLQTYCACGRNLQETARQLDQHVNTVRRRLERIAIETGLSWHDAAQMDQLSLACLIRSCEAILAQ